jgi:hypothetical protein
MTAIRNAVRPYYERINPGARHFIWHYVEMLLAMFIGMIPLELILLAAGTSSGEMGESHLVAHLLLMAVAMTIPMVAWMRYRGHSWQLSLEMSSAMFIPTLGALLLYAGGLVEGHGRLMVIEHNGMFVAMLLAMLPRRAEYTGHAHAR